jgi:3-deoxy-D-manno-octulosonic-acid transferase
MGDPIYVPREAGAPEFESYQKLVEAALDDVTAKAYALAGADMTRATPLSIAKSPIAKLPS